MEVFNTVLVCHCQEIKIIFITPPGLLQRNITVTCINGKKVWKKNHILLFTLVRVAVHQININCF